MRNFSFLDFSIYHLLFGITIYLITPVQNMPFPPRLIGKLPHILPPPMTSSTPGTWAYDTMSNR
jgi:hypothetical protein